MLRAAVAMVCVMSAWCSCACATELGEPSSSDARAAHSKGSAKLLAPLLLLVFSKVAIFKAVSLFLAVMLFRKMFVLGGALFDRFVSTKSIRPSSTYGAPPAPSSDTLGYDHGGAEHGPLHEAGYPGSDSAGSFDWLLNKHGT